MQLTLDSQVKFKYEGTNGSSYFKEYRLANQRRNRQQTFLELYSRLQQLRTYS